MMKETDRIKTKINQFVSFYALVGGALGGQVLSEIKRFTRKTKLKDYYLIPWKEIPVVTEMLGKKIYLSSNQIIAYQFFDKENDNIKNKFPVRIIGKTTNLEELTTKYNTKFSDLEDLKYFFKDQKLNELILTCDYNLHNPSLFDNFFGKKNWDLIPEDEMYFWKEIDRS